MYYKELKEAWSELTAPRRPVRDRLGRGARRDAALLQERAAQRARAVAVDRRLRRPTTIWSTRTNAHLRPGAQPGERRRRLAVGPGRAPRRPGGHRHAQLSGMDADLLGLRVHRRRRGRHERLVGRRGDGVRAQGLRAQGGRSATASGWSASRSGPAIAAARPRWSRCGSSRCRPASIAWAEVLAEGGALPEVSVDPDADACIFYTSGTTGHPKGAQLTHRGCVANLFNMIFSGQVAGAGHRSAATGVAVDPDRAAADPGGADHHAAVPRHRQQLRRLRRHRRRRQDGADVPLGRRRGAEADRARAGHRA